MTKGKMVVIIPLIVFIIIAAAIGVGAHIYEDSIKKALLDGTLKVTDLNSTLINIASIIFAISGAWIALVFPKEGANKQVISSQADSLIKISRIWADFFPANTSNQPI
ncbi:hypothetical protein [Escherichia coli]|uniref:hypothetical protein n=1 Tax=Escherichia coli TaxID=562 RepID=UPI0014304F36|nr:hypothetical protein [Escherichia coli]